MFYGEFQHTVDSKGRLSIPVKYRDYLNLHSNNTVIMAAAIGDPCLQAYPLPEWEAFVKKVEELPVMEDGILNFRRFLYSNATECLLDGQGRILIPPSLRNHVELNGNAVVVGLHNKFEVWGLPRWQEKKAAILADPVAIKETLSRLRV